jgi:hypothetical protein
MPYILASTIKVILLSSEEQNSLPTPVWRLADWSIQVGEFKDGYELEELALASPGSYIYGWLADLVDTMLFSPDSQLVHTLLLKIPEAINLLPKHLPQWGGGHKGQATLSLPNITKFKLDSCESSIYLAEEDRLLLITTSASQFQYDEAFELAQDLSILFCTGNHVGWLLKNASAHIPPFTILSKVKSNNERKKKDYLLEYLTYFSEESKDGLEQEDSLLKSKLDTLRDKVEKENNEHLREIWVATGQLIDAYYG